MKRKLARELVAGDYARHLISGEPLVQIARSEAQAPDLGSVPRQRIECHSPRGRLYTLDVPVDSIVEIEERPGDEV